MTLNDFLAKASELFNRPAAAEPNKEQEAALVTAKADLATLTATHAETVKQLEAANTTIADLRAQLEKAQGEVNAQGTEIKNLQASIEAEKGRTDATLAAMGVPPQKIPAEKPKDAKDNQAAEGEAKIAEMEKMQGTERVVFYRKNKAAIDAAYRARY